MAATKTNDNGLSHRRLLGLSIPDIIQSMRAPRTCGEPGIDGARLPNVTSEREIEK